MADSGSRGKRFDVRSVDGTSIAVWVDGQGPPLVLVHGSLRDHAIAAVPRARTRVLGGYGHLAYLTHPALVADIVTRFISE